MVLSGLSDSIVKGGADHHDIQPLSTVVPYAIYLQLGCGGRHEDRPPNLQLLAAVCDPLGVVAGTGGDYSSCFFLFGEVAEGGGCASDLETADGLQVLSFEVDVGLVLCRKI